MRLADRPRERGRLPTNGDGMCAVRHQAVAENGDDLLLGFGSEILDTEPPVFVSREGVLAVLAPLGDGLRSTLCNHTSSLSMAEQTDPRLKKLYAPCADEPNLEIHASSAAILSRLEETSSGELSFTTAHQEGPADKAFYLGTALICLVMEVLDTRFNRLLDEEIAATFRALFQDQAFGGY